MLSGNHYLDAAGNIDYLRVMSKGGDGGRSSAAGGVGRSQNEPRVFHTYGGGKRREGLLPSRASLGVSSRLDAATAPWKKMLELDAEEKKQVRLCLLLLLLFFLVLAFMPLDIAR